LSPLEQSPPLLGNAGFVDMAPSPPSSQTSSTIPVPSRLLLAIYQCIPCTLRRPAVGGLYCLLALLSRPRPRGVPGREWARGRAGHKERGCGGAIAQTHTRRRPPQAAGSRQQFDFGERARAVIFSRIRAALFPTTPGPRRRRSSEMGTSSPQAEGRPGNSLRGLFASLEALSHSPSQMPLSCPVAPQAARS